MDNKLSKENQQNAIQRSLVSSFEAAGMVPLNRNRVLDKLPREDLENGQIENVLIHYLKEQRFTNTPSRRNIKRTKLVVEPGKTVTAQRSESSSSDSDVDVPVTNDNSDDENDIENIFLVLEANEETEYLEIKKDEIKKGSYLLVKVIGGMRETIRYRYVAIVENIVTDDKEEIEVLGMKSLDRTKTTFKAEESDKFIVDFEDIIAILPDPTIHTTADICLFKKEIDVKEI